MNTTAMRSMIVETTDGDTTTLKVVPLRSDVTPIATFPNVGFTGWLIKISKTGTTTINNNAPVLLLKKVYDLIVW